MNRLRMVFCGTPQFAVPSFQRLISEPDFKITAVFTQPDRPRGRGQEISSSPVKMAALAAQIPVYQPAKIRAPEIERQLREQAPEVIVIIAYGQIIPVGLLNIPRHGWINLHASLLPKYRGAAPIHWAIANGEKVTGNTSMRIDAGMDTGEILLQQEMPIGPEETAPELSARLAEAGAELMVATLRGLVTGQIAPRPQNHAAATYAPMLKREDGWIDWARTAQEIYNRMRGFAPWPGAYTEFRGQTCHVWGRPSVGSGSNEPAGTIVVQDGRLKVTCGAATVLELTHVKLEGRRQVTAAEFANGARLLPGERLGKS
jgi:methionyl-tRNA formyltransferase